VDRTKNASSVPQNAEISSPTDSASTHKEGLARWRALKAQFDIVHQRGMTSLKAGDLDGLREAIAEERAIIGELGDLIRAARPKTPQE
jgi:hypothetical protein